MADRNSDRDTRTAFGAELGQQLGRIAPRGPGREPDQAEGEGQAEDGPGKIEEIHTLQGPAQSALWSKS